jgi:phage terminase small subunit
LFCIEKRWCIIAKLSLRQQRFVDEYIISGNATQAAIKAGYSERTAGRIAGQNLKKLEIKAYLDEKMAEFQKKNIMSADEALSILSDIARGKRDEEVLMMDPTTGEVRRLTKKADNATVIKAIQEILKRYPTTKQAEKLELEIEKLRTQMEQGTVSDMNITIIDEWSKNES